VTAGLVGITSACAVVQPYGALAIGILSGGVYVVAAILLKVDFDPSPPLCVTVALSLYAVIVVVWTREPFCQMSLPSLGGGDQGWSLHPPVFNLRPSLPG